MYILTNLEMSISFSNTQGVCNFKTANIDLLRSSEQVTVCKARYFPASFIIGGGGPWCSG